LALSRTLFRRSLLAGALVALGNFLLSGIRRILTHRLLFHISLSDLTRRISPENFRGRRKAIASFSVKRQVFFYPCFIGRIEHCALSEMTLALCTFGHQQVSTAAWLRNTLPVAVILKRFATAFWFCVSISVLA